MLWLASSRNTEESTTRTPSAQHLVATLKQQLGPRHHELIADLFERITLWSFEIQAAKKEPRPDGSWRTTLTLNADKFEADAKGAERQRPLDQAVPVSVYDSDPTETAARRFETVSVALRSGTQTVSFVTKMEPQYLRVNPSRALAQRNVSKTTIAVVP